VSGNPCMGIGPRSLVVLSWSRAQSVPPSSPPKMGSRTGSMICHGLEPPVSSDGSPRMGNAVTALHRAHGCRGIGELTDEQACPRRDGDHQGPRCEPSRESGLKHDVTLFLRVKGLFGLSRCCCSCNAGCTDHCPDTHVCSRRTVGEQSAIVRRVLLGNHRVTLIGGDVVLNSARPMAEPSIPGPPRNDGVNAYRM
jgi:hypothetical protein